MAFRKKDDRNKTPPVNPLTSLENTYLVDEPPPEPPDLHEPTPRREYIVYPRDAWGARAPLEGIETMELPVTTVVYTAEYEGYVPACRNKDECCKSLRLLQDFYMDEKGFPDIPYNFIVGGDGNVYEGRGWESKPDKALKYEEYRDKTIDIGMIIHFINEPVNKRSKLESNVLEILIQFVQDHIDDKIISTEYTIEGFTGKRKY